MIKTYNETEGGQTAKWPKDVLRGREPQSVVEELKKCRATLTFFSKKNV